METAFSVPNVTMTTTIMLLLMDAIMVMAYPKSIILFNTCIQTFLVNNDVDNVEQI
jgi:hypothetical protein